MDKKALGGMIVAAAAITALCVWWVSADSRRQPVQASLPVEPESNENAHTERHSVLSKIDRPKARTQEELNKGRFEYVAGLRQKFEKDGLAACLKDAVERPMADVYRQDLLIKYIDFSLEDDGLDRTMAEIKSGLEPGSQRDKCIELAFGNTTEDLDVLRRGLLALDSAEERNSAAKGLESAISSRDVPISELLATFPEPFLLEHILKGAAYSVGSPFNPTEDRGAFIDQNVTDLVTAIGGGKIEKGAIGRFVKDASMNGSGEASFHLWDSINHADRMEGLSIHPTTYQMLANSMINTDPARALSSLAASQITIPPEVITESAKNWLGQQNVQPERWLDSNGSNLKPEFKDAFISGFIDYNLANGGIDESLQWSQRIQDPDLKVKLQDKINQMREK